MLFGVRLWHCSSEQCQFDHNHMVFQHFPNYQLLDKWCFLIFRMIILFEWLRICKLQKILLFMLTLIGCRYIDSNPIMIMNPKWRTVLSILVHMKNRIFSIVTSKFEEVKNKSIILAEDGLTIGGRQRRTRGAR